jgi:hypothetical protein
MSAFKSAVQFEMNVCGSWPRQTLHEKRIVYSRNPFKNGVHFEVNVYS